MNSAEDTTEWQPFNVVWQSFDSASPTGRRLPCPTSFPYLVAGVHLELLQTGKPAPLGATELIKGILVAFNDPSVFVNVASAAQQVEALNDLVVTLGAASLEILLLDGCATISGDHGPLIGRAALENALQIVPQSAMLLSDLLMTLWSMLPHVDATYRAELLSQIALHFPALQLDVIDADAVETLVLAYVVALTFLPNCIAKRDPFINAVAINQVRSPVIARRIAYLLSSPTPEILDVL